MAEARESTEVVPLRTRLADTARGGEKEHLYVWSEASPQLPKTSLYKVWIVWL